MKIGILTFHKSYNYGAFMQCFSLVSRIKKDFPDWAVEVIDYSTQKIIDMYDKELNRITDKKTKDMILKRRENFKKCWEYLPLSEKCIVSDDYSEICEYMNDNYDAVVVGSDAVWNWKVRGFPNLYFLKDYKGEKFSYAASVHGMNYQDMDDEQKEYLKEAFSEFEYIGVRDVTTENMVSFCESSVLAVHNCDPTAFLDLNAVPCDMEALKEKLTQRGVDFSKPVIGLMAGNRIGMEIKRYYKNKVQLVALFEPNKYADIELYDLPPFEWARVFSLFDVTVTHFFHGTMLSLVNGTPVIPVEPVSAFSEKNTTKIKDVLTRLGLHDWRYEIDYRNKSIVQKVLNRIGFSYEPVLWKQICKKIDELVAGEYTDLIREKINREADSYTSFYEALKKIND